MPLVPYYDSMLPLSMYHVSMHHVTMPPLPMHRVSMHHVTMPPLPMHRVSMHHVTMLPLPMHRVSMHHVSFGQNGLWVQDARRVGRDKSRPYGFPIGKIIIEQLKMWLVCLQAPSCAASTNHISCF